MQRLRTHGRFPVRLETKMVTTSFLTLISGDDDGRDNFTDTESIERSSSDG